MGGTTSLHSKGDLTDAEKKIVRSSWEKVMRNKDNFVTDIFIRVFSQDPASHEMFEQMRGIPVAQLRDHPKMKAHAIRVAAIMNCYVEELDSQILPEMFLNLARTHQGKSVGKRHYQLFGRILLESLQEELKGDFNQKTKDAWSKAFAIMEAVLLVKHSEIQ